ncbi:hypothetical protein [Caloramator proteoclasticus]|uniref:Uncharacterized protein n=1 Tax=Caloramator proteoclasticus DSM 10124 TaxID=1121262 RepID=A0A1M4Y217_9CLOT|nr:hypothetical protein [Caloramator proteoclasticus]SHE99755.1 hypothetical protein SAMN02746091_01553 [Caloramator proteoclasticus DSM 10124]
MKYVIYVLSIALITAFLIIYGRAKEYYLPTELTNKLYIKCRDKILKYLSKNKSATYKELEREIEGVTAKVFWSRKVMTVLDSKKMVKGIIDSLLKQDKIQILESDGKKLVVLK